MAEERIRIVTLLTDFGNEDPWVGVMKGVLSSIQPTLRIIDLTHAVPPHDVFSGAFTLYRSYADFPTGTINLCVVDPGVGGERRPLIVQTKDYLFVGPDNGLFSFLYKFDEVRKTIAVEASWYFRKPVSRTFHGRDVFAPVAAWLARGIDPSNFGREINDFAVIPVPVDSIGEDDSIEGEVCAVDRFGNLITNVRRATLDALAVKSGKQGFKVVIAGKELDLTDGGYEQDAPLFALVNSSNLVEIAADAVPASKLLGVEKRGAPVKVTSA